MHNLTKIKIFRIALYLTYPLALLLIFPWVLLKRKNASHLFFFFDRYAIGGAQRIHLDILNSIQDVPKQVYFTRKSPNDKLKHAFYSIPNSNNKDIHFWCDNLLFRLFTVHLYVFYVNRHSKAVVLSSNSTFFYDMLPFFRRKVHTIELLHNFSYGKKGMEFFGLANHQYLDNRIVYDSLTLSNIKKQYEEYGVNSKFLDRILFIEPGVDIPVELSKNFSSPLKVLYAGRGGPQKRVWLVNTIAEHFIEMKLPVKFHFAGPIAGELSASVTEHSVIHGEIGSKEKMNDLYLHSHIIILTSAYEGFPMVIKEGMAYGCVPIVTALEGNKMHLKHEYNSLLIADIEDETKIIQAAIYLIHRLLNEPELLKTLSSTSFRYAAEHFNKREFMESYRKLLLN